MKTLRAERFLTMNKSSLIDSRPLPIVGKRIRTGKLFGGVDSRPEFGLDSALVACSQ